MLAGHAIARSRARGQARCSYPLGSSLEESVQELPEQMLVSSERSSECQSIGRTRACCVFSSGMGIVGTIAKADWRNESSHRRWRSQPEVGAEGIFSVKRAHQLAA